MVSRGDSYGRTRGLRHCRGPQLMRAVLQAREGGRQRERACVPGQMPGGQETTRERGGERMRGAARGASFTHVAALARRRELAAAIAGQCVHVGPAQKSARAAPSRPSMAIMPLEPSAAAPEDGASVGGGTTTSMGGSATTMGGMAAGEGASAMGPIAGPGPSASGAGAPVGAAGGLSITTGGGEATMGGMGGDGGEGGGLQGRRQERHQGSEHQGL